MVLQLVIEIKMIWVASAVAISVLILLLHLGSSAQDPVEATFVRGQFSGGDGIWHADDFGWFFYDLDTDQGREQLSIDVEERRADKGKIVYTSQAWSRQFEYKRWGNYNAVAFLGQLYLAGYPHSSFTEEIDVLGKGELRKVLLDENEIHNLNYNNTLTLQEGYVLGVKEISGKNDATLFVLFKNGKIVHSSVASSEGTFVYKKDDTPVIMVHLANAMKSPNSGFAQIDAIFQISDIPSFKLFEGGKLGNMKLTALNEDILVFQNDKALQLHRDSIIPLTGNLLIVILDSPDLVYYPEGGIFNYGLHDVRGPKFNSSSFIPINFGIYNSYAAAKWDFKNFSGFYFDSENALGSESMVLHRVENRIVSIPTKLNIDVANKTAIQEGFQYTSFIQSKQFEFDRWGNYFVISFLGNQFFAGYDTTQDGIKANKSLLENGYLGLVLMDRQLKGVFALGNYTLAEGYEMQIRDLGNDSIFLRLLKNGIQVNSSVVKSKTTYVYKKDINEVKDMPIIMAHVDNVFESESERFAVIDGIFQISDQYILPIEEGLDFGKMEIVSIQPGLIAMVNNENVTLNRDSTVAILPGMNIRVADDIELRYYLYTSSNVVPRPKLSQIEIPHNTSPIEPANFSMIAQAAEIQMVRADILDFRNRPVFSRDITELAQGSGDHWRFSWNWSATTLQLSDDNSSILDPGGSTLLGLLYLNDTSPSVQVSVKFDSSGWIAAIFDGGSIYYITREEYGKLNVGMNFDAMMANETARNKFIQIVPGVSKVQFFEIIEGTPLPDGLNHTLQGSLEILEPHAVRLAALPGRYALQIQLENVMGAIQVFGGFFNVTDTYLGAAEEFSETISDKTNASSSGTHPADNATAAPVAAPMGWLASLGCLALAALWRRRS
jgi:S-layer protein (TIGR01567 family)